MRQLCRMLPHRGRGFTECLAECRGAQASNRRTASSLGEGIEQSIRSKPPERGIRRPGGYGEISQGGRAVRFLRSWPCLLLVILCAMIPSAPQAQTAPSDLAYARPGKLVDIGGLRLNLRCSGSGMPTVVFDAGLSDWSPAWATVQPVIARRTRACSYDRAGNGFSDAGPMPRTSGRIVAELHRLLQRAGERPPFVLVGHSFGSFNVRLYADRYLHDVAGIVLVDGSHEDQGSLMDPADVRAAAKLFRACERVGVSSGASMHRTCYGLYFRGLPERRFSAGLNTALERQALAPKQAAATLSELLNFGTVSAAQVRAARRSFGDIPLRILTATNHRDPSSTKGGRYWRAWEMRWRVLHDSWLPLSTDATNVSATGSGHYIQFDRTPLVIDAIEDVVARARLAVQSPEHAEHRAAK